MAIKLTREDYIWQWASAMHLGEAFPDEIVIGDDEAMEAWIEDHKVEDNECMDANDIMYNISTLAGDLDGFIKFLKERGEL